MKTKKRKIIEINLGVLIIVIAITVIAITMLKYYVEGEKDMPYMITKMVTISTANGKNNQTEEYKWNIDVYQNTDIYFDITRNSEYKTNENIKNVKIEDIQINPKGKLTSNAYAPAKNDTNEIFTYTDENIINSEISYIVDKTKDVQNRKITSEGGVIALSFCIPNIGTYQGNDDKITYDGTLLNKLGITIEDISYEVKFNLIIQTESDKKYKAEITLQLPQEDIVQKGIVKTEDTELKNIVFKRI